MPPIGCRPSALFTKVMPVSSSGSPAKSLGGGSSAVAASAHANCARFRGTDPLIVQRSRRTLARDLGFPDTGGKIHEARWMRAMTFEKLVKDHAFASRLATSAVGARGVAVGPLGAARVAH